MAFILTLVIAAVTWLVWVPAASLQRAAKGMSGNVSIFPVVPCFPLVAWAVAYWAKQAGHELVIAAVMLSHLVLLVAMLVSIAKSKQLLRRRHSVRNGA
jgi:hypothetical protein